MGFNAGPNLPRVMTAQQQQAEQMRVYWKARPFIPSPSPASELTICTVHRGDVDQPWESTP